MAAATAYRKVVHTDHGRFVVGLAHGHAKAVTAVDLVEGASLTNARACAVILETTHDEVGVVRTAGQGIKLVGGEVVVLVAGPSGAVVGAGKDAAIGAEQHHR